MLINELSATDDWIELVNSSAIPVDLGGWKVADRDKKTGEPKLSDAVTFPPNTMLPAGAYGLVRAGGLDSGQPCPTGDHVFCALAEFGISNKDGEAIFLSTAPARSSARSSIRPRLPRAATRGAASRMAT